ncbi:lysis system i-spanin subunit Rz [Pseudomonas sp. Pseusp11]|uniref:lysis protein n=1 Tax=Pseudomonas sp. Pseusp11 TaxID=3243003 RepID=UPI0039B6A8F7
MPVFGLMPVSCRAIGLVVFLAMLAGSSAALAWHFQDWRYGQQLAEQARVHTETLSRLALAAATQQQAEQDKRLALEQRLSASEQTHYRALSDAERDQGRLRDRLATADVRLSVLLDAHDAASTCAVPAASGTGGVDHGAARARLDPAHAQRIIAITDAGDRGLIALAACQEYVKTISVRQ